MTIRIPFYRNVSGIISFLVFFFYTVSGFGQSISGKVSDSENHPVKDAQITLTNTKVQKQQLTDENGFYKVIVPPGNYSFEIVKKNVTLFSQNITIDRDTLKNIAITIATGTKVDLNEVTIISKKKLMERKVDRTVFTIANSINAQGVDAVEALSNTPQVKITDNAILIAGKSSVAVMINDRLLNLQGEELLNYLKNIRSDDIAKIEVITTPPAKYSAEGLSGLINIILKKNNKIGWNASLQAGGFFYTGAKLNSGRSGGTFNYQNERLSLSTGFNYTGFKRQQNTTNNIVYTNNDYWNNTGESFYKSAYISPNLKAEYKLTTKSTVGFTYNYSAMNTDQRLNSETFRKITAAEQNFQSLSTDSLQNQYHSGTVFYDLKLDTLGTVLRFSGNYLKAKTDTDKWAQTYENSTTNTLLNNNTGRYQITAFQSDLEKKLLGFIGEFGLKYTAIRNDALLKIYDIENGIPILNTAISNNFFYQENNYAAYFSFIRKLSPKWEIKAGLRYEYTYLKGSIPNQQETTNHYGQFFPTGYLTYKPNDDHAFNLSYSRRINRPNFQSLNPFRRYYSTYEYQEGNPYLRPAISNSIELNYTLKNNFNVSLYYTRSDDNWDKIIRFSDGFRIHQLENFYTMHTYGTAISYTQNHLNWMENTASLQSSFMTTESHIPDAVAVSNGFLAECNLNSTFPLRTDKTLSLFVILAGNTPYQYGNTFFYGYFKNSIGVKGSFLKKNLAYTFLFNDIFNTTQSKGDEYFKDFRSFYAYRSSNRYLNLSVTYTFGNSTIKGIKQKVQFDENNRAL